MEMIKKLDFPESLTYESGLIVAAEVAHVFILDKTHDIRFSAE
jgi:hypothetical protein